MKRVHIPGVIDVLKVDQASLIAQLADNSNMDRSFSNRRLPINAWSLGKMLRILSLDGKRFPTMRPRNEEGRAQQQDALWERLNSLAPAMRQGAPELQPLVRWVKGEGAASDLGPLLQNLVGHLFNTDFQASAQTWNAALLISGSLAPGNSLRKFWWRISGKLDQSKRLLASMLNNDYAAIHGTAIAIHNMVRGIRDMRALFEDQKKAAASSVPVEKMLQRCLHAPGVVFRQPIAAGNIGGCPYSSATTIMLQLDAAYQADHDSSMVFLEKSWSRCPAEQWVPAVLEGIWSLALAPAHPAACPVR